MSYPSAPPVNTMRKYPEHINWPAISRDSRLDFEDVREYRDLLDWTTKPTGVWTDYVTKLYNYASPPRTTEVVIAEQIKYISSDPEFTILREFQSYLDWKLVTEKICEHFNSLPRVESMKGMFAFINAFGGQYIDTNVMRRMNA